jgi:hypothetical protein
VNKKNMGAESEGGILDIHFGIKTDVDVYRISLVEKNTSDHCKKKQFRHIQRIVCLGMTGCMSTTPAAAIETYHLYHLCNLWLKIRLGTF